ncbi:DUF397 domain-containing protein [Actinomadura spongiicola]|uniref:DUF397 domain-containing protein n=1 Tax=Actinomadura spongiicola TaxID=2303421 RepID=A0A372G8R8_9ACTN|nr:DUF397 domain-containing protein [Actinomadura spongiicola]RFS81770.1 DUF397 domain-containing protein [Actinomadura spongiicola]
MESLTFRRSSRCAELDQEGCVEVASAQGCVIVRDSVNPNGPMLRLSPSVWRKLSLLVQVEPAYARIVE